MKTVLNHIALLVQNAVKAAEYLRQFDFKIGPAQPWEGEGTLEVYVGDLDSQMVNLLLMEPVKEGAYTRAMTKRGPGLFNHLGLNQIQTTAENDFSLVMNEKIILLKDLIL